MSEEGTLIYAGPNTQEQIDEFLDVLFGSSFLSSASVRYELKPAKNDNKKSNWFLSLEDNSIPQNFSWNIYRIEPFYVRYEDLFGFNKLAASMYAQEKFYGIKDPEGLQSLTNQVRQGGFGIPYFYPSILHMAAYYWKTIATKQMFNNGNKRTAILVAIIFMSNNGYTFKGIEDMSQVESPELYDISMQLANGRLSFDELLNFIYDNVRIDISWINNMLIQLRKE